MKTRPMPSIPFKNGSRSAKHENWTPRTREPPKTCPGAQNMIAGPDALGTTQNESGSAKYENWTRRPRYRRK
jgi:hypothetical protein